MYTRIHAGRSLYVSLNHTHTFYSLLGVYIIFHIYIYFFLKRSAKILMNPNAGVWRGGLERKGDGNCPFHSMNVCTICVATNICCLYVKCKDYQ